MLFFFAGYEIDFHRIRGRPLKLGVFGWMISLGLAYAIGGVLTAAGIVISDLYTGSAIATTAIGTLIPILRDAGEDTLRVRPAGRGRYGRVRAEPAGDADPSTANPLHEALILIAFVARGARLAGRGARVGAAGR